MHVYIYIFIFIYVYIYIHTYSPYSYISIFICIDTLYAIICIVNSFRRHADFVPKGNPGGSVLHFFCVFPLIPGKGSIPWQVQGEYEVDRDAVAFALMLAIKERTGLHWRRQRLVDQSTGLPIGEGARFRDVFPDGGRREKRPKRRIWAPWEFRWSSKRGGSTSFPAFQWRHLQETTKSAGLCGIFGRFILHLRFSRN